MTECKFIYNYQKIKVGDIASGTYKADVSGLEEAATYYVRAYVIQNEEAIYGQTTKVEMGYEPYVVTWPAYDIKEATTPFWKATLRGHFIDGDPYVSDVGFVYSTSSNPTIGNGTVVNPTSMSELTSPDTYQFTRVVTNLSGSKTYYYRAYVKNSLGYVYGKVESFNTY